MNDKTKRIILITACCLLCGVAVIGIAGRFGGNTVTPSGTVSGSQPDSNDPNVNINNSQGDVNVPSLTPEQSDPGQVQTPTARSRPSRRTLLNRTLQKSRNRPAARRHFRMITKRRMCRPRNARQRMNRTPHIRSSPPPSLRNPSLPREARTPPVRYMCRASAM